MSELKYRANRPSRDDIWLTPDTDVKSGKLAGNLLDARILIVDDQLFMRDLIRMALEQAGYRNLSYASDGQEALDSVGKRPPDLIVLDLVMPGMDGFRFCEAIRKIPQFVDTPILVQSSLDGGESRGRVFEVGASDVVSKPIEIAEFLSRVRTHLERHFLIKKLRSYYLRMEQEVTAMQEMQRCLLPDVENLKNLTDVRGLTIDACYEASDRLGGDLWGAHRINDHSFGLHMTDFSGRGAASSLNTFRLQTFIDSGAFDWSNPPAALKRANEYLSDVLKTGIFATMLHGVIDTAAGRLTWAAAGSPPPILVRSDGTTEELASAGLPLGITAQATYECLSVPFHAGDRLFLYSDGLIECPQPDKPVLSTEQVTELVASPALKDASEIIACISDELSARYHDPIPDDVSMLAVDWFEGE